MINSISTNIPTRNENRRKAHKKLVSATGYAAIASGTACGITGLKSVKFQNKMKVHKYTAYLAAAFTFLHLGIAKGLDKLFYKDK